MSEPNEVKKQYGLSLSFLAFDDLTPNAEEARTGAFLDDWECITKNLAIEYGFLNPRVEASEL